MLNNNNDFELQSGLSVMVDEHGIPTCHCPDSVMEYSKENKKCSCPGGGNYTEELASKPTFMSSEGNYKHITK